MKVRLSQPMSDLLLSKTANCRYPLITSGRLIIPVGGLREPSLFHWSRIKPTRPNSTRVATPYLILPLSRMVILLCCPSTGIPQYLPSNPNFRLSSQSTLSVSKFVGPTSPIPRGIRQTCLSIPTTENSTTPLRVASLSTCWHNSEPLDSRGLPLGCTACFVSAPNCECDQGGATNGNGYSPRKMGNELTRSEMDTYVSLSVISKRKVGGNAGLL